MQFTGAEGEVKIMTLDPGHFHAALVQKSMYEQVSSLVQVYGPVGPDVTDHLQRIERFNQRTDEPTCWIERLYTGADYLENMLADQPGNVVVISGNNRRKADYLQACVNAGLHVLADKPMCVDQEGFARLEQTFVAARDQGVLLYDIMSERFAITSLLQKELAHTPAVFGQLEKGTFEEPAVIKESVHHFSKMVSGNLIKRPLWYFDTNQQGEGIVDVTSHLVDLVMWGSFPEEIIDYQKDIEMKMARHWPTMISLEQFSRVTRAEAFPDFLLDQLNEEGLLHCYANGEMAYTLKGVHVRVMVRWDYQAPEGAGDTHFSVMRGSKAHIVIRQGPEKNYRPEVYVEPVPGRTAESVEEALKQAISELQEKYPGVGMARKDDSWRVVVPDSLRIGHEAHFEQVTKNFLRYLVDGYLPAWEVPNMIAKYYTTTQALAMAQQ